MVCFLSLLYLFMFDRDCVRTDAGYARIIILFLIGGISFGLILGSKKNGN